MPTIDMIVQLIVNQRQIKQEIDCSNRLCLFVQHYCTGHWNFRWPTSHFAAV